MLMRSTSFDRYEYWRSRSADSSPFIPRSASQSPKKDLTGIIENYKKTNGAGFIRLINYGPHHLVHFRQKHILQNKAWCKKGAVVSLDLVPMEVTPYKYEGRNIVVCKSISNLINEKPILQEQSTNPKPMPIRKKKYADLTNEKTQDFSKRMNGTICDIFRKEKFGYIAPDNGGDDIWFHYNDNMATEGIDHLCVGDRVSFLLGKKDEAIHMKIKEKVKIKKILGKILRITDRGFGYIQRNDTLEEIWFHNNDTLKVEDIRQFKSGDCVSFLLSKQGEGFQVIPINIEEVCARKYSRYKRKRTYKYSRSESRSRTNSRSRDFSDTTSESVDFSA